VFDAATIDDTATFEQPKAPAAGVECVLVNGRVAYTRGDEAPARHGRFLARAATSAAGGPMRSTERPACIAADLPALTIAVDSTAGGFAKPSTAIGSLSSPDQLPACRRLDLSFSLLSVSPRCVHSTPR
jgi:hypothetical protein